MQDIKYDVKSFFSKLRIKCERNGPIIDKGSVIVFYRAKVLFMIVVWFG